MSVGNYSFYPSKIEDRIDNIVDDPHYIMGTDLFTADMELAIFELFTKDYPDVEWKYFTVKFPDGSGGSSSLSWIEDGHLHMIGWDFVDER